MTQSERHSFDLGGDAPHEKSEAEQTSRLSIRLAEILDHVPAPGKRPGIIRHIVTHTRLDRHQVAALLNNRVRYIPLDTLAKLCDYLIEYCGIPASMLPGALFGVQPESFWEMLARRQRVEFCMGVRKAEITEWQEGAWVNAADSLLLGQLLAGISTLGGSAKYRRASQVNGGEFAPATLAPHPDTLTQSHVWAPRRLTNEVDRGCAEQVYDRFRKKKGGKGLVCVGSMKSNTVVELLLAHAFDCVPFESQDGVASASDRSVPFYFRYRAGDPQPPSCAGGQRLSRKEEASAPGIYYENEDGTWSCCPWTEAEHEVAFVFYVHREGSALLEMAVGGYSGRGTLLLSQTLALQASEFWKPQIDEGNLKVGAFLVQYKLKHVDNENRDILRTDLDASVKVLALPEAALVRRFPGFKGRSTQEVFTAGENEGDDGGPDDDLPPVAPKKKPK